MFEELSYIFFHNSHERVITCDGLKKILIFINCFLEYGSKETFTNLEDFQRYNTYEKEIENLNEFSKLRVQNFPP